MSLRILAIVAMFAITANASKNDYIRLGSATPSSEVGTQVTPTVYYASSVYKGWNEALFACQFDLGGALLSIETLAENNNVRTVIIKQGMQGVNFWTAGQWISSTTNFRWATTGGLVDFGNWGQFVVGNPIYNSYYNLVVSVSEYYPTRWSTYSVTNSFRYICEV